MEPIDLSANTAQCGTCGVIGLPAEMHRTSLPIAGSLPTVPNAVTYRCRDAAACVARLTYTHRNDALKSSDDPLYAASNVVDRLRGDLTRIADDLAAVQDAVGRFRAVHYQGEPDEATIRRVAQALAGPDFPGAGDDGCYREDAVRAIRAARIDAEAPVPAEPETPCRACHPGSPHEPDEAGVGRAARVIAEHFTGSTLSAEDPMFHRVARNAIKAAQHDAEEPDLSIDEARKLRELADVIGPGFDPDAGLAMIRAAEAPDEMEGVYTRFVAAQDAYEAYRHERCIEVRYDSRGDCDGEMVGAYAARSAWEGVAEGAPVALCTSHWQQAYRAGEASKAQPTGEPR